MLTRLLAADPATPPSVLTYLAAQPLDDLTALTLAAHPHLPERTPLPTAADPDAFLDVALAHPGLPSSRRLQYIDAARTSYLCPSVAAHDHFTPDELTHIHATRTAPALRWALASNAATPATLAPALVSELWTGSGANGVLIDVLTLRHHLAPLTPAAQAAALAPDPLADYARRVLGAAAGSQPCGLKDLGWDMTITAFPHPLIVEAALEHASDPTTDPADTSRICFTLLCDSRTTPEHRYRAATLYTGTVPHSVSETAPDRVLAALLRRAPYPTGWNNLHASDATLRELLNLAIAHAAPTRTIAPVSFPLHPGATAELRTDALATFTSPPRWLATLVRHLNTHGTVLDAPVADLHTTATITHHGYHWAAAAWAQAHADQPPATLSYAQALLTLEAGRFPGTLRELFRAARTIAA